MKRALVALTLAAVAVPIFAWGGPAWSDPHAVAAVAAAKVTAPAMESTSAVEPTSTVEPVFPAWMKRYWGRRVHRVITARKVVALTLDDGPTFRTDDAVRILDRYGAKGTFFVIGTCSKQRGMAAMNRYVLAHGDELANHTMHHARLTSRSRRT